MNITDKIRDLAKAAAIFPLACAVALAFVLGQSAHAQQDDGQQAQPAQKTKTERLLKAELDPFTADENGWTHLHWAAAADDGEAIRRLVAMEMFLNPVSNDDLTAFSEKGKRRAQLVGLKMGNWANAGHTPLHIAAYFRKGVAASVLIASGADVNMIDAGGNTPVNYANNNDRMAALFQHMAAGTIKSPIDALRGTPPPETKSFGRGKLDPAKLQHFFDAAENGDLQAVRWLIANGADVNAKNNDGWTPLLYAARKSAEVAKLLIDNGAEVNAKDEDGRTPLLYAAGNNAAEVAKLLIDNGADVNAKNKKGRTPLHWAAGENAAAVAKLLIDNGAEVNAKSNGGVTSLHAAAFKNAAAVAKLLIDKGANIEAKDNDGDTPLSDAAYWNRAAVAKLLIDNGADVNAKNKKGRTPLHWAAGQNAGAVAKLLIDNGADVNAKNKKGRTPLDWAIVEERFGMQSLLRRNGGRCNKKC